MKYLLLLFIFRLYVNYRFMRGIEQQFLALQKGLLELVPAQLLRPFDERELELVICGLGTIDINDWKTNTRLKVGCIFICLDLFIDVFIDFWLGFVQLCLI